MTDPINLHGWTAVPRDATKFLGGKPYINKPEPLTVDQLSFPKDTLVQQVKDFAQSQLTEQTFNHSMRVYYFGLAILTQQLPHSELSHTTYALTALLHDIGTTQENLHATQMSFEYFGGMLALHHLQDKGADMSQAEAVTEAIFRHQDLGEVGKISLLGQIIQLATIYDNIGGHPELIHPVTLESVCHAFPRKGWSGCFSGTIQEENSLKPWANTTALGEDAFPDAVAKNQLMAPFDNEGL